ncbi:hypothetical protein LCGC14_0517200 [marine sediment metagenome]|uniref:Glycosyltransferase RgtA/B/C/D-like domain-containing protein n=1 Tax=marine sediment metagenome TaxID=412755 RepID=A0A0F9UL83_9ZZZZ
MDDKNAAPRVEYYFLAIGVAVLIAMYPSLSLVAVGLVLVWYSIKGVDEYRYLAIGFIVAFLLRAAITLSIFSTSYHTGNYYGFGPDGLMYSGNAWALVSVMRGTVSEWWFNTVAFPFPYSSLPYWSPEVLAGKLPNIHSYPMSAYVYLMMFIYWIFGFVPLTVKLLNCVFGVSAALVQYFIAKDILGQQTAKRVYPFLLFFPTTMIWSTTMLRDPLFYLVFSLLFLALLRRKIMGSIGLFAILYFLRKSMVIIIPAALVLSVIFVGATTVRFGLNTLGVRTSPYIYLVGFVVLASVFIFEYGSVDSFKDLASMQVIQSKLPGKGFRIYSDEAYEVPDFRYYQWSAGETVKGALWGLESFYLKPYVWKVRDWQDIAVIPQMLLWYIAFPLSIIGVFKLLQGNPHFGAVALVFTVILLTGAMVLTKGNEGTLVRHRDMLTPFYLIFAMGFIFRR